MDDDVKRWRGYAVNMTRMAEHEPHGVESTFVPDLALACRIALAAEEWEEWSSCNLDQRRTEMLQSILRGEGPERFPPEVADG